jgi:hypothetical protein
MAAAIALVGVRVTELLGVAPAIATMSKVEAVVVRVLFEEVVVCDGGAAELGVKAAGGMNLYCGFFPPI